MGCQPYGERGRRGKGRKCKVDKTQKQSSESGNRNTFPVVSGSL